MEEQRYNSAHPLGHTGPVIGITLPLPLPLSLSIRSYLKSVLRYKLL